jgi:hypothetical protein
MWERDLEKSGAGPALVGEGKRKKGSGGCRSEGVPVQGALNAWDQFWPAGSGL